MEYIRYLGTSRFRQDQLIHVTYDAIHSKHKNSRYVITTILVSKIIAIRHVPSNYVGTPS